MEIGENMKVAIIKNYVKVQRPQRLRYTRQKEVTKLGHLLNGNQKEGDSEKRKDGWMKI